MRAIVVIPDKLGVQWAVAGLTEKVKDGNRETCHEDQETTSPQPALRKPLLLADWGARLNLFKTSRGSRPLPCFESSARRGVFGANGRYDLRPPQDRLLYFDTLPSAGRVSSPLLRGDDPQRRAAVPPTSPERIGRVRGRLALVSR